MDLSQKDNQDEKIEKIPISIVIPAYNEESNIEKTLSDITEKVSIPHEILVVEDHCTDNTPTIVERFSVKHPEVRLLHNQGNRGFGNTVITGITATSGKTTVVVMADLCDDASSIDIMYKKLKETNADLVCGSRYMKGGKKVSGPKIQGILSNFVAFSLRLITRIPTSDVVNAFKLYRSSFLKSINYKIYDTNTDYSMRLTLRAYFNGAKIIEIPTIWRGKNISVRDEFKIFKRTKNYLTAYMSVIFQVFSKEKIPIIFFTAIALIHLLSVGFVYAKNRDISPIQDALEYRLIGKNIIQGHGFSVSDKVPYLHDMLRVPSFTIFLGLTYLIEDRGLLAITIQQIFLIISAFLLYKLFVRYGYRRIGLIFTAFFIFEPLQWMLSLQTMSETFYSFFLVLSVYFLITRPLVRQKFEYLPELLAGLFAAIAILARPVGTVWLPGFLVLMWPQSNWRQRVIKTGIFCTVIAVCLMPWLYRNYKLVGRPTLSSSYEYNIIIGFGNEAEQTDLQSIGEPIYDASGRKGLVISGFTSEYYSKIKAVSDYIIKRVGKPKIMSQQLMCTKKVWFNSRYTIILDMISKGFGETNAAKIVQYADNIFWAIVIILMIFGLVSIYTNISPFIALGFGLILVLNSVVTLCISYTRMRVPLQFIIFLVSGIGIAYIFEQLNKIIKNNFD